MWLAAWQVGSRWRSLVFAWQALGWARWREMASASVSEELLVDGGWEDMPGQGTDGVTKLNAMRTS